MHWVRKPRLNSAVATVAVLMVFSLLRVASLSVVMILLFSCSDTNEPTFVIPRCAIAHLRARVKRASPESITTTGSMDSGPAPSGASRNDGDSFVPPCSEREFRATDTVSNTLIGLHLMHIL